MRLEADHVTSQAFELCVNQETPGRCSILGPAPFTIIDIVPSNTESSPGVEGSDDRLPVPHRFSA